MTQLIRSAKWFGLAGLVALAGCADPRLNLGPDDLIDGGGSNGQHTSTQAVGGQGGSTSGGSTGGTTGSTSILSCDAANLPERPRIDACAQPIEGWVDAGTPVVSFPTRELTLSGTVKSVTRGKPGGGCASRFNETAGTEIIALTVTTLTDDIMRDYSVGYQVPSNTVTWSVGDPIEVNTSESMGVWFDRVMTLTLRRNQVTEVYVHLYPGSSTSSISIEPFKFDEGAEVCRNVDGCGTVAHRDLLVTGATGVVAVPLNRSVNIDEYRVTNGGFAQSVGLIKCVDWSPGETNVAVLRNPPQATP